MNQPPQEQRAAAVPARPVSELSLLLGILLVAANLRAGITVVGPLLGDVQRDLHLGGTVASALVSLPVLCFGIFSVLVPRLLERFGTGRVMTLALAVLAAGLVTRSLPGMPLLWLGTVLLGTAIATLNVSLPVLVKRDFPQSVGQITGLFSSTQSTFAALAAGLAVPLALLPGSSWRVSFGFWAVPALLALSLFLPLARRAAPPPATPGGGREARAAAPVSPWRVPLAWQITLYMGTQSVLFYTVVTWWPSIEQANGITAAAAGAHQSLFQLMGIVGSLVTAALLRRWPRDQRPVVGLLLLLPLALLGQLCLPGLSLLWNVLLGFGASVAFVLAMALFGLRTRTPRQAAELSGMAQSVGYLLAAAGPLLIGAIHQRTGNWTAPLLVLLGVQVVMIGAALLATRDRSLH